MSLLEVEQLVNYVPVPFFSYGELESADTSVTTSWDTETIYIGDCPEDNWAGSDYLNSMFGFIDSIRTSESQNDITYNLGEMEVGDTFSSATDLGSLGPGKYGTSYSENIVTDDHDYYKFQVKESGTLEISSDLTNQHWYIGQAIYDENQNRIDITQLSEGDNITKYAVDPGAYYIDIYSGTGTTAYELNIGLDVTDTPNDRSNAKDIGVLSHEESYTNTESVGSWENIDSADWYKFTLDKDSQITADLSLESDNGSLEIFLTDNNGKIIVASDSSSESGHLQEELAAGSYYLKTYSSSYGLDKYNLSIVNNTSVTSHDFQDITNLGTLSMGDDLRFNITESLSKGSSDWYKFTLDETSPFDAQMTTDSVGKNIDIYFYDDQGSPIALSRNNSDWEKIQNWDLDPDTYYLRAFAREYTNSYDLDIELSGSRPAANDIGIMHDRSYSYSKTLYAEQESSDWYKFSLEDQDTKEIVLHDNTDNMYLYLYDENGNYLYNEHGDWLTFPSNKPMELDLYAGTFYLRAYHPYSSEQTEYTLTIDESSALGTKVLDIQGVQEDFVTFETAL